MSFRRRTVLLASAAVALAVVLASVVVYLVTAGELRNQVDAGLRQRLMPGQPQSIQIRQVKLNAKERTSLEQSISAIARAPKQTFGVTRVPNKLFNDQSGGGFTVAAQPTPPILFARSRALRGMVDGKQAATSAAGIELPGQGGPEAGGFGVRGTVRHGPHGSITAVSILLPSAGFGDASGYAQLVLRNGEVVHTGGSNATLPITAKTKAVADGRQPGFFSDATVDGTKVRVLTERARAGRVWQVALPLANVSSTLEHLLWVLAAVSLGGILLAAALGLLVSRAALSPVRRLTGATERIAKTQDLAHRIPEQGGDELGRLASSFNTMLAALERSRLAQRQLVSDASHELRTPLTSVQANLEALALDGALSPAERAEALTAARAQLQELTLLIGDLVNLSKTEVEEIEVEEVRLDLAAYEAVRRAHLHAPGCELRLSAEPCIVRASPAQLDRAIANMLDNAIKWSPSGAPVEVKVRNGGLEVRDHGPGIAAADLPRVFDRFYRAAAARGKPGSGLGLAIVRQLAETHGGTVHAGNDPGGGARLVLELPAMPMSVEETLQSRQPAPAVNGAA